MMNHLVRRLCRFVAPAFVFICFAGQAATTRIPDPVIADKVHITVQQLHSLRARFDLDNEQVLALAPVQLQLMLFEIEHPGIDLHAEEQNFRALHLKDENGHIAANALAHAMNEHRRNQHRDTAPDEDLFPTLPDPSETEPDFGSPGASLAGISNGSWPWRGPGNIGGRVRS